MKIRGQVIKPQKMEKVGQSLTVSLQLLLLPAQSTASQSTGCTQSNHRSVLMITTLVAENSLIHRLFVQSSNSISIVIRSQLPVVLHQQPALISSNHLEHHSKSGFH